MKYCPKHDHHCMVAYYNAFPCSDCEQANECEDCIALNNISNENNVPKEDTMKCQCKFNNGKVHDVKAYEKVTVLNNGGSTCYHQLHLPERYVGGNWTPIEVYVCRRHFNNLVAGKAINIVTNNNTISKEETMDITREQLIEELNTAKALMKEMREHPYTDFAIANGDAVGDRIDMLTNELKEFDTTNTAPEEETMNSKIQAFITNTSEDEVEAKLFNADATFATNTDNNTPKENIMNTTTNNTVIITGLLAAIEYAKSSGFHGTLPKVPNTNTYEFPLNQSESIIPTINPIIPKEDKVKTNNKQIKCGFCHNYHDTMDEIAACGGKTRIAGTELRKNTPFFLTFRNDKGAWMGKFWLPNHTMAQECIAFYGVRSYHPAKNGHGFWVYITPSAAMTKGDFMNLIATYKANKVQAS